MIWFNLLQLEKADSRVTFEMTLTCYTQRRKDWFHVCIFLVAKRSTLATKFVVQLHLGFETASTWPRRVRPSLTKAACNGWSASCRINLSNIHASTFCVYKKLGPRSVWHSEPCRHKALHLKCSVSRWLCFIYMRQTLKYHRNPQNVQRLDS